MSEKKYVAYVGSYTHGSSRQGIHVYDVDVENGTGETWMMQMLSNVCVSLPSFR